MTQNIEAGARLRLHRAFKFAAGVHPDVHAPGDYTVIEAGRRAGCINAEGAALAVDNGYGTIVGAPAPAAGLRRAVAASAAQAGYPKHTGGGWYALSNGSRVKGKAAAAKAQAKL